MKSERIPREKIAVVTGDQKELDGINLFSPSCPIDYVVTVEALKEGWDCSFAYVFCSVANVQSRKDVEQILGRVLRMPYARRRAADDLNRAYAHVSRASWPNAVKQLHDKLVEMGFEQTEADSFIEKKVPELPLPDGGMSLTPAVPPVVLMLEEDISTFSLTPEEQQQVRIEKTPTGSRIIMTGNIEDATVQRLTSALRSPENKAVLAIEARRHKAAWRQHLSPLQRGVSFRVPQLCLNLNGSLEPAESESLLGMRGWNLLDYAPDISEADFRLTDTGVQWEIDIGRQGKLTERVVGETEQRNLDLIDTGWTQGHLCRWLERQVRQIDLKQTMLLEFVRRAVASLTDTRRLSLTSVVRYRFALAKVLQQKISQCRADASTKSYQQSLFDAEPPAVETSFNYAFDFGSTAYAPHWSYAGHPYGFQKHYYPNVGELKNSGEEFECAKALDMTRAVKHWVRNLERRGFWLPLALGKFYPDFVAELDDGRILVVEHKGQHLASANEAQEKESIGNLWEDRSGGRALFLMTVVEKGKPGVFEQIRQKLTG
jgi:type III restriction enzyme